MCHVFELALPVVKAQRNPVVAIPPRHLVSKCFLVGSNDVEPSLWIVSLAN